MRYVNRLRALFATGATTIGISPKLIGVVLTGAVLTGLRALGVVEPSAELTAAIGTVALGFVAWLLPPGLVAVPDPEIGPASDDLLGEEARRQLEAVEPPRE